LKGIVVLGKKRVGGGYPRERRLSSEFWGRAHFVEKKRHSGGGGGEKWVFKGRPSSSIVRREGQMHPTLNGKPSVIKRRKMYVKEKRGKRKGEQLEERGTDGSS